MNNELSTGLEGSKGKSEEEGAAPSLSPPLLKIVNMLHNNTITQKKKEIHKTQSIADTERLWTQIDKDIAMGTIAEP